MKIKVFISIIESFNSALFIGLIFCVFTVAFNAKDGELIVFEVLIIFPFLIAFLLRISIINWYLKRCKYPVPLISVLQKLGLLIETDINWSVEAQKDLYRPTYSTDIFLTDNGLKSSINDKHGNYFAPILQFSAAHLKVDAVHLLWPNILDWNFVSGGEDSSGKVNVFHIDKEESYETSIDLDIYKARKIDVLLLLSHYKGKYG